MDDEVGTMNDGLKCVYNPLPGAASAEPSEVR